MTPLALVLGVSSSSLLDADIQCAQRRVEWDQRVFAKRTVCAALNLAAAFAEQTGRTRFLAGAHLCRPTTS